MPALKNAKHEKFAQLLHQGESASTAYVQAGYKANDGNAIRLKGNEKVQKRLAELSKRDQEAAFDISKYTIRGLMQRLTEAIDLAIEEKKPKDAVSGIDLMLDTLGYKGQPTLARDHLISGSGLTNEEPPAEPEETEVPKETPDVLPTNVTSLRESMKKIGAG